MSISIDFTEFIEEVTIYTTTYTMTDGITESSEVESNIEAIFLPYSSTSFNNNPTMRDISLEGKDTKGILFMITDADIKVNETNTFFNYDDKRYKVEQRMPYNKIIQHYEYLTCIVDGGI